MNWNNTNTDNTRLLWITNAYQLEHHLFESQQFNGGAPTTLITAQITPDKDTDVTKIHLSSSDAGYLTDAFNALAFLSDSQSDIATRFELTLDPNYAGHSNNAPLYAQSPLNSLFNYTESLNISGLKLDSNDSLYVDARNFGNDIDVSLNRLSTPSLMSVKLTGGSGSDTFLLPDLDQYLDKSFESGRIKAFVSMNVNLGEGDDNFVVSSDWYMRGANATPTAQTINFKLGFDGGAGSNTLTIAGADREIDLNTLSTFFKNIENINLNGLQNNTVDTGNGNYNLTLSLTGLDKITDANHQLFVNGDNGDTVTLTDGSQNWTQQEDQTVNDITYHVYSDNVDASHQLYIQDGINITLG